MGSYGPDPACIAQQAKSAAAPAAPGLSPEKAINLAEQGHCRESIAALKRAMISPVPPDTRKQAGVVGIRCSLSLDDRDSASDFIRLLNKQFSQATLTYFSCLSMPTPIYPRARPRIWDALLRNLLLLTN